MPIALQFHAQAPVRISCQDLHCYAGRNPHLLPARLQARSHTNILQG